MNNEQFLALAKKELDSVLEIIKAKNSDYTAGSDDPFANFRMCKSLGLADAEVGVLIRMVDKIQRVKSFLAKGELQVKNESVQDALRDIIGYSLVLLGMTAKEETRNRLIDRAYEITDPTKFTVSEPHLPTKKISDRDLSIIAQTMLDSKNLKSGAW